MFGRYATLGRLKVENGADGMLCLYMFLIMRDISGDMSLIVVGIIIPDA